MKSRREADENFTIETRLRIIQEKATGKQVHEKPARGNASPNDIRRIIEFLKRKG